MTLPDQFKFGFVISHRSVFLFVAKSNVAYSYVQKGPNNNRRATDNIVRCHLTFDDY